MQQESVDDAERNHFLVNYVDYAFDDFGGRQPPVYPGLSTVWEAWLEVRYDTFFITYAFLYQLYSIHSKHFYARANVN